MRTLKNILFIYLDDMRVPPSRHWTVVRTAEQAYEAIRRAYNAGQEMVLSLDHDLGEEVTPDCTRVCRATGYDLLSWLEKDIAIDTSFRPNIAFCIHSANPVGRENMGRAIKEIERMML